MSNVKEVNNTSRRKRKGYKERLNRLMLYRYLRFFKLKLKLMIII